MNHLHAAKQAPSSATPTHQSQPVFTPALPESYEQGYTPEMLSALQKKHGNQFVQRLVAEHPLQRTPAPAFISSKMQPSAPATPRIQRLAQIVKGGGLDATLEKDLVHLQQRDPVSYRLAAKSDLARGEVLYLLSHADQNYFGGKSASALGQEIIAHLLDSRVAGEVVRIQLLGCNSGKDKTANTMDNTAPEDDTAVKSFAKEVQRFLNDHLKVKTAQVEFKVEGVPGFSITGPDGINYHTQFEQLAADLDKSIKVLLYGQDIEYGDKPYEEKLKGVHKLLQNTQQLEQTKILETNPRLLWQIATKIVANLKYQLETTNPNLTPEQRKDMTQIYNSFKKWLEDNAQLAQQDDYKPEVNNLPAQAPLDEAAQKLEDDLSALDFL